MAPTIEGASPAEHPGAEPAPEQESDDGFPERQDETTPESFTLKGTPSDPRPGIDIRHAEIIKKDDVTYAYVVKTGLAYQYLEDNNGVFNNESIETLYRNNRNPYGFPLMLVREQVDVKILEDHLGSDLRQELTKARVTKNGKVIEPISFFAVKFEKKNDGFIVTNWLPEFILHKFSQ